MENHMKEIRFRVNSSIAGDNGMSRPICSAVQFIRSDSALEQLAPTANKLQLDSDNLESIDFCKQLLDFWLWTEYFGASRVEKDDIAWNELPDKNEWSAYFEMENGEIFCYNGTSAVLPDLVEQLCELLVYPFTGYTTPHKERCSKKFGHSQKNDVCGKCLSSTPALYQRCQFYRSPFNFDTYKRIPVYRCRDCGCTASLLDRWGNCSECHSSDVKILTGQDGTGKYG